MITIISHGRCIELPCSTPLHTKSRIVDSTSEIKVARDFHQPWQCPIAKAIHSLFVTTKYWCDDPSKTIKMPTCEGHHLIAVQLDADDEVCISLRNLVAFGEDIQLRAVLDFSIAAWAISQTFQFLAKGPGVLVFDCAGEPTVWLTDNDSANVRIQLGRLVLWPKDLQFVADKVLKVTDLYMGETRVFVRRSSPCPLVLDVEHQESGGNSVLELLSRLYRPW